MFDTFTQICCSNDFQQALKMIYDISGCRTFLPLNYSSDFKSGESISTKFCVGQLYLGW